MGAAERHLGDDERVEISNSALRAETIRAAVDYIAQRQAEVKSINADINEYRQKHIKGDLGMKLADFAAVYRVSQLEVEDRDQLLDTLQEGFAALGIGGQLDWVAADRGEPQPTEETAPRRRRAKATGVAPISPEIFAIGKADGLAGVRDHAARYPNGEIGAAAYELGHREGELERQGAEAGGDIGQAAEPAPAKRGRGRPRKEAQPGLALVEGGAGEGETQAPAE
jgi:hypothetical protein